MQIDVKFSSWDEVKAALAKSDDRILFDSLNYDRVIVVEPVNTYEWDDCMLALQINLDRLLGGCWYDLKYQAIHLERMIKHFESEEQ